MNLICTALIVGNMVLGSKQLPFQKQISDDNNNIAVFYVSENYENELNNWVIVKNNKDESVTLPLKCKKL